MFSPSNSNKFPNEIGMNFRWKLKWIFRATFDTIPDEIQIEMNFRTKFEWVEWVTSRKFELIPPKSWINSLISRNLKKKIIPTNEFCDEVEWFSWRNSDEFPDEIVMKVNWNSPEIWIPLPLKFDFKKTSPEIRMSSAKKMNKFIDKMWMNFLTKLEWISWRSSNNFSEKIQMIFPTKSYWTSWQNSNEFPEEIWMNFSKKF